MKKILHFTLFLAIVSAIAGAGLGFANEVTAPIIAENNLKAEIKALKIIYSDVSDDQFKLLDLQGNSKTIQKVFKVDGKGYIYKLQVKGYKDGTVFLVALDDNMKVVDFYAISNGDTSGIGTKVTEDSFRQTLQNKDATDKALTADVIGGATISSEPILQGINEAAQYQADFLQ